MKNLIRNTSIYAIGNIIPQAAGFILLPIYTRYITPYDYGIVGSMQVLNGILAIVFTLAVDRSLYRIYWDYETEKERKDYLGSVTLLIFFISTISMILTFIFHSFLGLIYKSISFYPFFAYTILATYFSIFAIVPKIYLQLHQKAGSFIAISIAQFILSAAFVLWCVVLMEQGAVGMLKGQMIGCGILIPVFIYMCLKNINIKFKVKIIREGLKFSLPMMPVLLSSWVLNLSDRIFIERYFSLSDVGIYSLGYKVAGIVLLISSAFYLAYTPVFYSLANAHDQAIAQKKLYLYNNTYIIVILLICFLVSFFSKEAITILLDARYAEAYRIVPIISLAYFISQSGGLLRLAIYQEKKTLAVMITTMLAAGLNLGLNFLLVPAYGAYGAGLSAVFSFAGMFAMEYWYAKRCYFVDFDWKTIMIGLLLTVSIISTVYILDVNIYLSLIVKIVFVLLVMLFVFKKFNGVIESMLAFRKLT